VYGPGTSNVGASLPACYNDADEANSVHRNHDPSYYCDDRPELATHIARTRNGGPERRDYECFISEVVLSELARGSIPISGNA